MARSDPATSRQVEYIRTLFNDRQVGTKPEHAEQLRVAFEEDHASGGLNREQASGLIEVLQGYPRKVTVTVDESVKQARVGVYALNGEIYVVKPNRDKTRLYAKRLVEAAGNRLHEDGSVSPLELEYAPGVVRQLREEHRLPADDVAKLSVRYGRCVLCGNPLKAAASVQRMIGPVCWKKVS